MKVHPWMIVVAIAATLTLGTLYYIVGNLILHTNTLTLLSYLEISIITSFTARGLFDLYFYIQDLTTSTSPHPLILSSPVDDYIPFTPSAIWIYSLGFGSLCGIVPLAAVSMTSAVHLISGGILLILIQCLLFYLFPTTIPDAYRSPPPRPVYPPNSVWGKLDALSMAAINATYDIDGVTNAAPSGHVSISTYAAVAVFPLLGYSSYILPLAIAASACMTKQHCFLDTVLGFALGHLVASAYI